MGFVAAREQEVAYLIRRSGCSLLEFQSPFIVLYVSV